jgi:glycine hydroxymethyltransferase
LPIYLAKFTDLYMDLFALTSQETQRHKETLNLIASENYPSPQVMELVGSSWMWKYGEGYAGKRYYAGNVNTDTLENYTQELALKTFDPTGEYGVNVQMLSGSPANGLVYLSLLKPGDTVMSMALNDGGHLSHLHSTSAWGNFFKYINYGVTHTTEGFEIDYADFKQKLLEHKPKLVIIGFSAYPAQYQFEELIVAAHEAGALVMADIAHISGVVAAGLHDSPFKPGELGADVLTMTTHKTLRGPRGGLIFAKKPLMEVINKTAFPGSLGGPHFNQIAGYARMFEEVLGLAEYPDKRPFKQYIQDVLTNAKALEQGLVEGGLEIVTKTGTHLVLAKLPIESDSLAIQKHLETIGIITNRNTIPGDTKTAWKPSGVRVGSAPLTSRGATPEMMKQIGIGIAKQSLDVAKIVADLKWWY